MVRASPDLAIWKLSGEYTTAASTLPASKLGTRPPPPTGTRVKSIFFCAVVHNASRSEPEPAEAIATFLPARSTAGRGDPQTRAVPPRTTRAEPPPSGPPPPGWEGG